MANVPSLLCVQCLLASIGVAVPVAGASQSKAPSPSGLIRRFGRGVVEGGVVVVVWRCMRHSLIAPRNPNAIEIEAFLSRKGVPSRPVVP